MIEIIGEERYRADRRDYGEPRGRDDSVDRREAERSNFSKSNERWRQGGVEQVKATSWRRCARIV